MQWKVRFAVVREESHCSEGVAREDEEERCIEFPLRKYEDGKVLDEVVKWCQKDDKTLYDFAVLTCQAMEPHVTCVDKVLERAEEILYSS